MRALLFLPAALLLACSDKPSSAIDGGVFTAPDSGYIFDGGPPRERDAEAPDTGPYVCPASCAPDTVCGCPDTEPLSCGCNPAASFQQACDPQVPETCKPPYTCAISRKLSGPVHLCTDGREGAFCSHAEESCNTALGCVCQTDFLGTQCWCRGDPGPNPTTCDPMVPASCPDGTCVRVVVQGRPFFVCSDGSRYQPCVPGDDSCNTSLGCTCALAGSRDVCTCSEPGTAAGEPCDPSVAASCVAPLTCQVRYSEAQGGYVSECAGSDPIRTDGGTLDPYACDPAQPMCPMGFVCEEIGPNRHRCVPDR